MTSLIKVPFASSGDKTTVPDTDAGGSVNMTQGYGQAYSLDPATDPSAKRIEREKMNWLFNIITSAVNEIQVSGVTPFISSSDNGGSPYSYGNGAITSLGGVVYQSIEDGNTTTPPGSKWAVIKNDSNGLTRQNPFADIKSDGASAISTALSNLGLSDIVAAGVGTGVLSALGRATLPLIIGGVKQNLIIQWGNITTTAGSGPITFPLAFPTALLASYSCEYNSSIWKPGSDASCAVYGIDTKSRTGMRIASLTYAGGTWINVDAQCQWLAIGY